MTWWLCQQGRQVNPKRVKRLTEAHSMGLEAICAKPRCRFRSQGIESITIYRADLTIDHPDHCRAGRYHVYLHARRIRLSGSHRGLVKPVRADLGGIGLDGEFLLRVRAGVGTAAGPPGFSTQTRERSKHSVHEPVAETRREDQHGWPRSGDGHHLIERLWRTVKYENIFLHDYADVSEVIAGLKSYFRFYNHERPPSRWETGRLRRFTSGGLQEYSEVENRPATGTAQTEGVTNVQKHETGVHLKHATFVRRMGSPSRLSRKTLEQLKKGWRFHHNGDKKHVRAVAQRRPS